MVNIVLKAGQSGYDAVGEYVRRYWDNNICDDVIVSLSVSRDGRIYELIKCVAYPINGYGMEFLSDWWEGERYIELFGIQAISELDISGGIYEEGGAVC